jgi:RimJ/RimL family protein N-acetyltransferase
LGEGITPLAINKIVQEVFMHFDINRIFARPFQTNIASQKVLEKCGFILEGTLLKTIFKNNELLDELIYAVRKS